MIRKYIDKIADNGKREDMDKLGDMLAEILEDMKDEHPDEYNGYKLCLYEMAYGKVVSEDMANKWVKEMEPVGMYWTMDETTGAMQKLGYNFNKIDFYITANMMMNDYHDLVKDDEILALKMARDWLDDSDAVNNKLYEYWKYIAK